MIVNTDNSAKWEIWLDDPRGNRLVLLDDVLDFSIAKVANNVGAFQLNLRGDFDTNLLPIDGIVEFWRGSFGGPLKWIDAGFIRGKKFQEDSSGNDFISVYGPDAIDLLQRRIIAYFAGESYSTKTDYADDMMKDIVRENLGASVALSARNLTAYGFTVQVDFSQGDIITKSFSWKNVLTTLKEIADSYTTKKIYFDVVPTLISNTTVGFEFRTYLNQIGKDLTFDSGLSHFIFGKEWGNLKNASLTYDYTEETNQIYVGGQGDGLSRNLVEVYDTARKEATPWNRREEFADARNETTTSGIISVGYTALFQGKPKVKFSGELLNTEVSKYGVDWEFGDKVTATYLGNQFDGMIKTVSFTMDRKRNEKLSAKMEIDQ